MLWDDGRSGVAGQHVGNLVLSKIEAEFDELWKRKGTVFESPTAVLVGRVCTDTSYLSNRTAHWANVSRSQHDQIVAEVGADGKALFYLFITANLREAHIAFWVIPGAVIGELMDQCGKRSPRDVFVVHIKNAGKRFLLIDRDVTEFHRVLELDESQSEQLTAFAPGKDERSKKSALLRRRRPIEPKPSQHVETGHYDVPISNGRTVSLTIPGALAKQDVERLKGWIDLMADILTGPLDGRATQSTTNNKRVPPNFGFARDRIWMSEDFDAPLDDFAEYQ